jgi:predicted Zn-dependent protease
LDEAARLDPEQTGPWMQLAQVRRDAGDLSGARTALEAATMRDPADAYARGTLADVLRALGDKEGARTQVTRAIRTLPNYEWGLGALARWGKEDGDGTAAERLVRELIAERPADPQVWLGLAHVLAATERVDERLAALDEAIRLQPRLIEAHDLRADALSAAGRYDEALLACRGEAWGGRPPLALQGQAACILMARGERASAITRMREVLAKHTDYLWGANQLAGWLRVDGTNQEYLAAAETLVRLAPRRALSYGTRAAARQRLNDVAGARADLARAQQLEADYLFAGFRLFDWQTEDGLQGEARRTFERMRPHLSTAWIPACEIVMHAARGDVARSRIELVRLLNAAGELAEPLRRAVRAMHRAFGFTCIESAIEAQWPGIRPETGAIIAGVLRR